MDFHYFAEYEYPFIVMLSLYGANKTAFFMIFHENPFPQKMTAENPQSFLYLKYCFYTQSIPSAFLAAFFTSAE